MADRSIFDVLREFVDFGLYVAAFGFGYIIVRALVEGTVALI